MSNYRLAGLQACCASLECSEAVWRVAHDISADVAANGW